jgi:ribosomal protein S18 acetylase RimI-like enzyme
VPKLELRPFADHDLDDAGALLAARHAAHRRAEPLYSPRFEDPAEAAREVAELWKSEAASGAVASVGGRVVGFLLGTRWRDDVWGPNVWVQAAGHAAEHPEIVRDLYGAAAARWVGEGRTAHYAVVPNYDPALVDAWFRLGFGQQQAYAIREASPPGPVRTDGFTIRHATIEDAEAIATVDQSLPQHQGASPVFSAGLVPPFDELVADAREGVEDPDFEVFVAEQDGTVVGAAVGSSIEKSSMHHGLSRPDNAGYLAFAAVLPEARGRGMGRALGETVLEWIAASGYQAAVTDWRVANLLSSRTWPRLGFRPSFLRLHRVTGH